MFLLGIQKPCCKMGGIGTKLGHFNAMYGTDVQTLAYVTDLIIKMGVGGLYRMGLIPTSRSKTEARVVG